MPFTTINRDQPLTKPILDIRSFFRNTVTPTARQTISQFLLDTEMELKGYQAEINRLQAAIRLLKIKKCNLNTSLERCRSLLSPVYRLPPEILTNVFSFACEVNTLEPSSPPPAIRIAMVCGRWRNTVLSTPNLWSSLQISFDSWNKKLDVLTRLAVLYMERSKSCPLALDISFPTDYHKPDPSAVIDVLSRSCARWRLFTLSIPETFTRPELLFPKLSGESLPSLKSLHLNERHVSNQRSELLTYGQLFGTCPSLCELRLDGTVTQVWRLEVPLSKIKRMLLRRTFTSSALKVLEEAPHIQELTLDFVVKKKGSEVSEAQHFLSSSVKTLCLCMKAQEDLNDQLRHLTIPSLEVLTISSCPAWRSSRVWLGWEGSVTENFLTRSGCPITSLCLQSLPITDTQTLSLLKLVPTLNSLKIEEPNLVEANPNKIVTGIFFRHFVVDQESYRIGTPGTTFLPLLTELTLRVKRQGLAEKEFLDAVASRWVPDAARARDIGVECLRSVDVSVVGNGGDSDSTLESLRCFRDAGLRLNVTYQSASDCCASICPSL